MNVSIARITSSLTLAAACIACMAATAGATSSNTTKLPRFGAVPGQVAGTCRVVGNDLYITGRFGPNDLASVWNLGQKLAVTSIPLRNMRSAGSKPRWVRQSIGHGRLVVAQAFDGLGRLVYVTEPYRKAQASNIKVIRLKANGTRLNSFGHHGSAAVKVAGLAPRGYSRVRVLPVDDGGVFVVAMLRSSQKIVRLTSAGKVDTAWGSGGELKFSEAVTSSAAVGRDGSLFIGLGAPLGAPGTHTPGVLKLTPAGKVDESWGSGGYFKTPTQPSESGFTSTGQVREITQLTNGNVAVAYADERAGDMATEYAMRLLLLTPAAGPVAAQANAGVFSIGGDGGFPDASPEVLQEGLKGVVFAQAQSFFSNPPGVLLGVYSSTDGATGKLLAHGDISGDPVGYFTADPKSNDLYYCGGTGKIGRFKQVKQVAVRRVSL